jgi:hypothetical protein
MMLFSAIRLAMLVIRSRSILTCFAAAFFICVTGHGAEPRQNLSPKGDFWISEDQLSDTGEIETRINSVRSDRFVVLEGLPGTTMTHEFAISPDERWLFVTGKIYHGLGGAWLFRHESEDVLRFSLASKVPFYGIAWNYFQTATRVQVGGTDPKQGIIDFVAWRPGKLRVSLRGKLDTCVVAGWIIEYDLAKKRFSIPDDATGGNRTAVQPIARPTHQASRYR